MHELCNLGRAGSRREPPLRTSPAARLVVDLGTGAFSASGAGRSPTRRARRPFRNPRYAPEGLEARLSPSTVTGSEPPPAEYGTSYLGVPEPPPPPPTDPEPPLGPYPPPIGIPPTPVEPVHPA